MSAGNTSQRFAQPKIEFACSCGKKYRVSAEKAGKYIRCKSCRMRLQVPGDDDRGITASTRLAILDELGINTDLKQAEEAAQKYACSLCGAKIKELESSYAQAGLVCAMCRETMGGGVATEAPEDSEKKKKKKKKKQLGQWTRGVDPAQARKKAYAYSALFFIGTLGFSINVISIGWIGGLLLAGAVAYGGGKAIYTATLADPVEAKQVTAK